MRKNERKTLFVRRKIYLLIRGGLTSVGQHFCRSSCPLPVLTPLFYQGCCSAMRGEIILAKKGKFAKSTAQRFSSLRVNYPRRFLHVSILLISDYTLCLLKKLVKRKFQEEVCNVTPLTAGRSFYASIPFWSRVSITTLSMFGTLLPNLSDLSSQLPGFQVFRALINLLA